MKKEAPAKTNAPRKTHGLVGSNLSFAAKEAYKLLRTNLDFALNDVEGCRIIGVTSAMRGEGKSLTSVNLAFALAEAGNRVLLLEADMRIPTLGKKLRLEKKKGLSNALIASPDEALPIQEYVIGSNAWSNSKFDILTAGNTPPNPSELLGSRRMQELMERLAEKYDYVIVDLPPVTAVTDALGVSKILDGILVIVRHDYSERGLLAEAMRQLELASVRVLGFVFNCASEGSGGYAKHYRYKDRYYRGYYRRSPDYLSEPAGKPDMNA